jgi:aminocarboxymuconate-semialdehyde decarboxylase
MIIDIHGHLSPPAAARRYPMPPSLTDVDGMLAARAEAGIDLTIIGSPVGAGAMMRVPGVDNYQQPNDRLRAFHDWLATLVERFPSQLRAYVYANPLGGDDHLGAALDVLANPAFVGFIVNSSVRGRLLEGGRADAFFAMAAEAGRPILVHPPAEPVGGPEIADFRFVEQVSRFCDVTSGLAMIAFAGWLDKYPSLRVIGATGGGAVAALPERLEVAAKPRHWGPPGAAGNGVPGGAPAGGGGAVRRLYVDTATASAAHLAMNVAVLGASRVMLGTDSPPLARPLRETLAAIRELPLDAADTRRILGGTAMELFGFGQPVGAGAGAAERCSDGDG